MRDLGHRVFANLENTDSWCSRKGDLQRAFHLDVLMVTTFAHVISTTGERLICGGFSFGEMVPFGSLEFIANCFGGLSLSPRRNDSGTAIIGSTHVGTPSPLRAMIEDSTEEFYTALSGEGAPASPFLEGMTRGLYFLP
jgi:hypothetical protein